MTIGVAIIGSGIFVNEEHLPAVLNTPSLTLKAIYSRTIKSAEALNAGKDVTLYSDAESTKNYHDLLLRDDIQAVIIALPILSQPEYIEAALAAGKHVLSEKPIAADLKRAQHLLSYYKGNKVKANATWSVAENFRFLDSFLHARHDVEKLGKITGFRVKMFAYVEEGSKYYETSWRKKPEYQGGFLLDGGVHFVAGTRLLLGEEAQPTVLTAYTTLLQKHLPPVDTVNSVWQTKSGISGTFSVSFGTTLSGSEYTIACQRGSVTIASDKVITRMGAEKEGNETVKKFEKEGSGVKQEVKAWAEALAAGKANPMQSPEQALADLEILEKMLRSGEGQGKPEVLQYQV